MRFKCTTTLAVEVYDDMERANGIHALVKHLFTVQDEFPHLKPKIDQDVLRQLIDALFGSHRTLKRKEPDDEHVTSTDDVLSGRTCLAKNWAKNTLRVLEKGRPFKYTFPVKSVVAGEYTTHIVTHCLLSRIRKAFERKPEDQFDVRKLALEGTGHAGQDAEKAILAVIICRALKQKRKERNMTMWKAVTSILCWHTRAVQRMYAPGGKGYVVAKASFEVAREDPGRI